MSTIVNVYDPSASATRVLSARDRARAKTGIKAAVLLSVAVGLVLFAVGGIYLNYVVAPMDLPFLGQFIGS
jgi:hypothetical protein